MMRPKEARSAWVRTKATLLGEGGVGEEGEEGGVTVSMVVVVLLSSLPVAERDVMRHFVRAAAEKGLEAAGVRGGAWRGWRKRSLLDGLVLLADAATTVVASTTTPSNMVLATIPRVLLLLVLVVVGGRKAIRLLLLLRSSSDGVVGRRLKVDDDDGRARL